MILKANFALTSEPCLSYFPSISPPVSQLKEYNDLLGEALAMETSVSVTALRKGRRAKVVQTLNEIAVSLELQAKGDLAMLAASGFELRKKPQRSILPTGIPENLRLFTTGIIGEVLAKCGSVPRARAYQAQWSLSSDGPWQDIDPVTSSQRILFTGLPRGQLVYIRVRAFGPNGFGGWSDIAVIMVV